MIFKYGDSDHMAKRSKETIPFLLFQYQGPQRNIGFTFSPLYLNDGVEIKPDQMLFIYDEDFMYIRPALDKAFPLTDPRTGEEMEEFDPCWDNPILKETWVEILAELDRLTSDDPKFQLFLYQFVTWIKKWLDSADGIEITGNL